ncbi:unnamed protein product [Moneuplotes crassus]|uniref:Uncharacterized protein n=1 Tax=Euplotes crassus TaxID=5936 RepID=A0AAD1XYR4_EUPCR|nr:unnamed protein product [Moneuplotes crassus]
MSSDKSENSVDSKPPQNEQNPNDDTSKRSFMSVFKPFGAENSASAKAIDEVQPPTHDASKTADERYEEMENYLQVDHERNAKFRRRLAFLFPYNVFLLWGSIKYAKNIHKIAKRFWPNRRKFSVGNFILIGTVQALFFTTLYAGGNLAILGINPLKPQESFREDAEFVKDSSNLVVIQALKYAGLSEDTIQRIENDLKNSDKKTQEDNLEQSDDNKEN